MHSADVIVETRQNGTAEEISITLTHRPTGAAVWNLAPDTPETRSRMMAELAEKVTKSTNRPRQKSPSGM